MESVVRVDRAELGWMAGVGALAALAFATTMSTNVALGDAPESVAGVASVGILHAPGYPAYVLVARIFSWLVPFGSLAGRTNGFSLVCAVLVVVGVFRLARVVGAGRVGAAVGAVSLALGTSFWFYADFAKHDAFSALLVTAASVFVVEWSVRGDGRLLVAGGVALGLTAGASWQLGALALPGLATLVIVGRGRSLRALIAPVVGGVLAAAAVMVFVVVRAGEQPSIDWGAASTAPRLVDLLDMKDFSFVSNKVTGLVANTGARTAHGGPFAAKFASYPVLLVHELSLAAVLLAGWGLIAAWRRLSRAHFTFLAVALLVEIVGTAVIIGPTHLNGFTTNLTLGGFLSGLYVVVAVLVAIGVTDLVARTGRWAVVVAVPVAAAVLVPSALVHYRPASHHQPPFAAQYATNVFRSLPPHAVILTRGAEFTFSLIEAQLVGGHRRDVTVVASDALAGTSWYRGQLARRLGMTLPDLPDQGAELVAAAHALQTRGPVYLDMLMTDALRPAIGYQVDGLVSRVVNGVGPQAPPSLADVERLLDHGYLTDGVYSRGASRRWPNVFLLSAYVRAHLELAREYNQLGQFDAVAAQVHMALAVDPADPTALSIERALAAR